MSDVRVVGCLGIDHALFSRTDVTYPDMSGNTPHVGKSPGDAFCESGDDATFRILSNVLDDNCRCSTWGNHRIDCDNTQYTFLPEGSRTNPHMAHPLSYGEITYVHESGRSDPYHGIAWIRSRVH